MLFSGGWWHRLAPRTRHAHFPIFQSSITFTIVLNVPFFAFFTSHAERAPPELGQRLPLFYIIRLMSGMPPPGPAPSFLKDLGHNRLGRATFLAITRAATISFVEAFGPKAFWPCAGPPLTLEKRVSLPSIPFSV
jgi:hypothetical protein